MIYKEINKYENLKNDELENSILWYNDIKNLDDLKKIETSDFPYKFSNSTEFINMINKFIKEKKRVAIIGDYDCDGVCSISILSLFLKKLNIDHIYIIGDRTIDGYGMNNSLIDQALEKGCNAIITVDNGIKCKNEVLYAKENGMDVIITDHHIFDENLIPDCLIYNPHYKQDLIFKDICGAFTIFVLIYDYIKTCNCNYTKEFLLELYELAALATISDVMPLYYFNRKIINQLLKNINYSNIYNKGLKMLVDKLIELKTISLPLSDDDISFKIVPIINAPGRISKADILVELFLNPTSEVIETCLKLNDRRRLESRQALTKLKLDDSKINILFEDSISEGILGIVAAQIKEKTNKPTIVFTSSTNGTIKGSGRSIDGVHLLDVVTNIFKTYDLALYYGGHEKAIGITLKNIDAYKEFKLRASNINYNYTEPYKLYIECKYPLIKIYDTIEKYKPYGQSFTKPLFHIRGIPKNIKIMKEKHCSFQLLFNSYTYYCTYFNNILEEREYDFYFYVSKDIYQNQAYFKCYIEKAL